MSEAQAERAVQRLYEDEGLRSELADDEAEILLAWSETEAGTLATKNLADDLFDEQFGGLRQLVTQVNRFIGKRRGMPRDAQRKALADIILAARALGYGVAEGEMEIYARKHSSLANVEALQRLIELMKAPPPND